MLYWLLSFVVLCIMPEALSNMALLIIRIQYSTYLFSKQFHCVPFEHHRFSIIHLSMYSIAPYNFSFLSICYSFCWINTTTLHLSLYTIKAIRFSIISFIGFVRRRNQQLHLYIKYIQAAASITVHHCAVTQNFSSNPRPDKTYSL